MSANDKMPFTQDHLTALQWFAADWSRATLENVESALSYVGRAHAPRLLDYLGQGLADDVLSAVVGHVWSAAEFPDRALRRKDWRYLFSRAGYTVDGKPAERPVSAIRLYRGAVPERRRDWSWTDDIEVAKVFAHGIRGRERGKVWTAMVKPSRLLARVTDRQESEYVVNTVNLGIFEVPVKDAELDAAMGHHEAARAAEAAALFAGKVGA